MPSKEIYKRIKANRMNCPKCGSRLDDKKFVTCSKCRNDRKNIQIRSEERQSAMSLFCGPKKE